MTKYIVEINNGCEIWKNEYGFFHREDGPAVSLPNGDKEWLFNGLPHRVDGPARICSNGHQEWYINGKPHREDGPAIISANGDKFWYINGKPMTEHEFNNRNNSLDGKEVTIDGKTYILKLK